MGRLLESIFHHDFRLIVFFFIGDSHGIYVILYQIKKRDQNNEKFV